MKIAFDIACLALGAIGLYLVLSHEWRMRKLDEAQKRIEQLRRPGPIWVVLLRASSATKNLSMATWINGKSEEEALGYGYKRALEKWPEKDGHHEHRCDILAIPQEAIDAAATKITAKPENGTEGSDEHTA